jgi:hypothetical protein
LERIFACPLDGGVRSTGRAESSSSLRVAPSPSSQKARSLAAQIRCPARGWRFPSGLPPSSTTPTVGTEGFVLITRTQHDGNRTAGRVRAVPRSRLWSKGELDTSRRRRLRFVRNRVAVWFDGDGWDGSRAPQGSNRSARSFPFACKRGVLALPGWLACREFFFNCDRSSVIY